MPMHIRRTQPLEPLPPAGVHVYSGEFVPFPPEDAPREQLMEFIAVIGAPTIQGEIAGHPYLLIQQWRRAVTAYLGKWHAE